MRQESVPLRKGTIVAFILLCLLGLGTLFILNFYKLDLVHTVVVNAVLQKAPSDYPAESIRSTFGKARRRAEESGQGDQYLERLFSVSQRLEKIQQLDREKLDELLEEISKTPQ